MAQYTGFRKMGKGPNGSLPSHQNGVVDCSGIELEYLGPNQSMWEQYASIEFSSHQSFIDGDNIRHDGHVYRVIGDATKNNDGVLPIHTSGTETCSGVQLEYIREHDLRIDFLRLIQDPIDEITDYYSRLLLRQTLTHMAQDSNPHGSIFKKLLGF